MNGKLIVAVDEKWAIGKNNQLLYSIPEDMQFFRRMTTGNVVVMGRRTLCSFPGGKPLPHRRNVVLSRTMTPGEGYEVVRTPGDLAEMLRGETRDIFVIGGGEIYSLLLPYCDTAYVTRMFRDFQGDVFFPNLENESHWRLTKQSETMEYEGLRYRFERYENTCPEDMGR